MKLLVGKAKGIEYQLFSQGSLLVMGEGDQDHSRNLKLSHLIASQSGHQ